MPKAQDGLRLLYHNGGGVHGFESLQFPLESWALSCQASNKVLNALALYGNPALEAGKGIVARFQPGNLHHSGESRKGEGRLFAGIADNPQGLFRVTHGMDSAEVGGNVPARRSSATRNAPPGSSSAGGPLFRRGSPRPNPCHRRAKFGGVHLFD